LTVFVFSRLNGKQLIETSIEGYAGNIINSKDSPSEASIASQFYM